jgi:hypothetical protein
MSGSTGVEVGNLFPIASGGVETFSYASTTDSDMMSGTVTWPFIKDGTTSPQFDVNAILTVLSSSGDATFTGDFAVGSTAEIDFTVSVATTLTPAGQPGSIVWGVFVWSLLCPSRGCRWAVALRPLIYRHCVAARLLPEVASARAGCQARPRT